MEPVNGAKVLKSCRIASGIKLIESIGNMRSAAGLKPILTMGWDDDEEVYDQFESCLFDYLMKCQSHQYDWLDKFKYNVIPERLARDNSHWWWREARKINLYRCRCDDTCKCMLYDGYGYKIGQYDQFE